MSQFKNHFIIFAHARSGSTNLSILLGQHPAVDIAGEPFHNNYINRHPTEENHIDLVNDEKTLDGQLFKIFSKYSGFKTLAYQLPAYLNEYMIKKPDRKIIFLRRKNLLQTVVSEAIATQTNIWYKKVNTELKLDEFPPLQPVDTEKLQMRFDNLNRNLDKYEDVLKKEKPKAYLKLYYEDFYSTDKQKNIHNASAVFDFLGLELPNHEIIHMFMNPKKAKMNTQETYRLIPNINEIESTFGNDKTGWLF